MAYHVENPRGTSDIDVNVGVDPEHPDELFASLPAGVAWGPDDLDRVRRDGQCRIYWGRTPVDLFFPQQRTHAVVEGPSCPAVSLPPDRPRSNRRPPRTGPTEEREPADVGEVALVREIVGAGPPACEAYQTATTQEEPFATSLVISESGQSRMSSSARGPRPTWRSSNRSSSGRPRGGGARTKDWADIEEMLSPHGPNIVDLDEKRARRGSLLTPRLQEIVGGDDPGWHGSTRHIRHRRPVRTHRASAPLPAGAAPVGAHRTRGSRPRIRVECLAAQLGRGASELARTHLGPVVRPA